ncbi:hypothetical protein [Atopobium fossor]|uniref:hypothetical protein n=1 Tax=Atopobium fossor TaxID=39487 RepID=UPI0004839FC5|nr:hypothetical protein [Atopobium fossor]
MAQHSQNNQPVEVSEELDALSCELLGSALDALAAGVEVPVIVSVEDAAGTRVTNSFSEDGIETCINEAHSYIASLVAGKTGRPDNLGVPVRYAIVYEGAVDLENNGYEDALILEFAEKDQQAFSAYVLWQGFGAGEAFQWCDPEPAGEVDSLL